MPTTKAKVSSSNTWQHVLAVAASGVARVVAKHTLGAAGAAEDRAVTGLFATVLHHLVPAQRAQTDIMMHAMCAGRSKTKHNHMGAI